MQIIGFSVNTGNKRKEEEFVLKGFTMHNLFSMKCLCSEVRRCMKIHHSSSLV